MTCNDSAELLSAKLDGELSTSEVEQLQSHLVGCAACQQLERKMQGLSRGFAHLPERTPPQLKQTETPTATSPSAATQAVSAVAKLEPKRRSFIPWLGGLAAAAAVLLFFWPKPGPESGVFFLSDGAKLSSTAPQEQQVAPQAFQTSPLYGTVGKLDFELLVDSQAQSCKDIQLELDYDFDGDGKVDRTELYRPFSTDSKVGWESYTDQGVLSAQGEMHEFSGGRITARLKNAPDNLRILQGKSKIVVPLTRKVS